MLPEDVFRKVGSGLRLIWGYKALLRLQGRFATNSWVH